MLEWLPPSATVQLGEVTASTEEAELTHVLSVSGIHHCPLEGQLHSTCHHHSKHQY